MDILELKQIISQHKLNINSTNFNHCLTIPNTSITLHYLLHQIWNDFIDKFVLVLNIDLFLIFKYYIYIKNRFNNKKLYYIRESNLDQ